jgi:hypothetical protein
MISTLTGENEVERGAELRRAVAAFEKEYGDMAVERLDGEEASYERMVEAVQSLPFLVVLARLREPGEWASPGLQLMTLADLSSVYAYIYVAQDVLHTLKPGQELEAFLPEAGDQPRQARIAFIRPEAEFTPKNVQTREERTRLVFGVKVALENSDGKLKPGMPIEVRLPR